MRGERGEVVGERERSVWRGVGWVGGDTSSIQCNASLQFFSPSNL